MGAAVQVQPVGVGGVGEEDWGRVPFVCRRHYCHRYSIQEKAATEEIEKQRCRTKRMASQQRSSATTTRISTINVIKGSRSHRPNPRPSTPATPGAELRPIGDWRRAYGHDVGHVYQHG